MLFLWTEHHRKLLDMSPAKQSETWFEWMNQGALHYELAEWQKAIPYLGCAFDLSCQVLCNQRGQQTEQEKKSTATQLTLSSIYLANAFQHHGSVDKAQYILAKALRALHVSGIRDEAVQHSAEGFVNNPAENSLGESRNQGIDHSNWSQECVQILLDQERHEDYFERYLNLPFDCCSAYINRSQQPAGRLH